MVVREEEEKEEEEKGLGVYLNRAKKWMARWHHNRNVCRRIVSIYHPKYAEEGEEGRKEGREGREGRK